MSHAIAQLSEALVTLSTTQPRLNIPLLLPDGIDPMEWLNAQSLFPKFYWQSRDGHEETVALGQVHTFSNPFIAELALVEGQKIWGGRSFDGRTEHNQCCAQFFFFLPQIELSRINNIWTLSLNVGDDIQKSYAAITQLSDAVISLGNPECNIMSIEHSPVFPQWANILNKALAEIHATDLQKVVLARQTSLTLDRNISALQLLKASRSQNGANFHFLFALDEKHCFIGSTPERLFHRHHHKLHTEALAGTIGRGKTAQDDHALAQWLFSDPKNIYENQLVVKDIETRLAKYSINLEVEASPHLIRLRKVQHLKRDIAATLKNNISSSTLLEMLQPTAAIAGLPRDNAVKFITDNEPFARGWYSGSIGFFGHNRSEFCVAIRSALIMGNTLHLFAGAGIVPGSEPETEWEELNKKISTLMNLLKPAPLPCKNAKPIAKASGLDIEMEKRAG
ncbi:Menaquinone-specific isochorismate synthase [Candidatus Enterovibrio altilux]|uniref:Isochorismate synthase MenF n=1 Tax=Candidatus Enterovibrio altilux TaxID=1927128 RepID=A0A291BA97_9GAMM|nr:isochorismate synthase [Candidatus Enterovibrio luxaltus]ATF09948.1 Menaquinone-specific isochorismate synthase [Candidatus Enterovibrio luxaltus]